MGYITRLLMGLSLAALAIAAPLNKRDLVTVTEYTTIDITTTIYDYGFTQSTQAPIMPTGAPISGSVLPSSAQSSSSSYSAPAAPSAEAGQFYPAPSPSVYTPASAPAPAATSSPADAASYVPQIPASSAASAPAPASSSPAIGDKGTGSTSSSAGDGLCTGSGDSCTGDITHFDGGLGACGKNVDTDGEMAVALPVGLMGSLSNSNPYCGKTVTLVNPTSGTTVTATVKDKCMGCADRAIDLTNKLFNAITDGKGDGRMHGIQWYFN